MQRWRKIVLLDFCPLTIRDIIRCTHIIAIIWGFWHLPLWLIMGYMGLELIQKQIDNYESAAHRLYATFHNEV